MSKEHIRDRVNKLKERAAERYNIPVEKCHIGHAALEGMLENPFKLHQIDGCKDINETSGSVANKCMRLASAMVNFGLKPEDSVVITGPNRLEVAVPFYACHFNGHSMCTIDPSASLDDLKSLYPSIQPKLIICQENCVEKNKKALEAIKMTTHIFTFEEIETFVADNNGTEIGYKPCADFDTADVPAWLMLTSGTTGLPKVSAISYDNVLYAILEWWSPIEEPIGITMTMTSTQWLSALIFYISTPLKPFTRLQSSLPITPALMVKLINTYRPNATGWTPYLLSQFIQAEEKICDLSSLQHILIGGSAVDKKLLDDFREICKAKLYVNYGMTELLAPVFDYDEKTPYGSPGKPFHNKYQYKLIDNDGKVIEQCNTNGELWIKGDKFFKGYLNNPEETKKVLTEDGWLMTGDIFYRDENDYYFFVERKKVLVRYYTHWVSPIQIEEVIRRHPGVAEACVVAVPNPPTMELAVGCIQKKKGADFDPQEIFDLVKDALPDHKQLHGGIFFVDSLPETPSGKVNRAKIQKMAPTAEKIFAKVTPPGSQVPTVTVTEPKTQKAIVTDPQTLTVTVQEPLTIQETSQSSSWFCGLCRSEKSVPDKSVANGTARKTASS